MGAHPMVLCVILCGGMHILETRVVSPVFGRSRTLPAAALRLIVAHYCSYCILSTFPVASEGSIGAVVVRSFIQGPALWLAFATLAIRLPFKVHCPVHALAFVLSSAPIQDACAAVSRTPGLSSSVFRSLEGGLDSFGLHLLDFVRPLLDQEYETGEFARRLVVPCSNPCAAFHTFFNFWAGFVVPSVVVWCAETRRKIRHATETSHPGGRGARDQPVRPRPNGVYGKGFSVVILLINVALSWEVSWRVAKKMNI
ncbi:hypothetical protein BSKO_08474 [Bryopsis sp. KO-2023]|nr:hypothetical protein BSKO_08474 [Bryopsis sp. KO-2023]